MVRANPVGGLSEPIALYVRIASILKGHIVRGDWPHGALIPGVDELSRTYSVARATARQALQMLVAEGLVISERGRGSRVVYVRPTSEEINAGLFQVVAPSPSGHRIKVLERRHGVPLNRTLFPAGDAFASYTLVRKVHLQGSTPYGFYHIYVASDCYVRLPRHADTREKLARLLIASDVELSRGEDVLTVESADWEEATHLQCPMASPTARIVRTIVDRSGRIVYAANNVYRGDRFRQVRRISGYLYEPGKSVVEKESNGDLAG